MAHLKSNTPKVSNTSSSIPLTPKSESNFLSHAQQLTNDADKYQAAVDLAKISLQDKEDVNDSMFKDAIDNYYEQMNPEKTGREMRGENAWTDFVGGARDGINAFNTGIGSAIDFAGDTLIGGALDLMGAKGAAEDFRNLATGEDLAIIPDIATDVALVASGVGIPLMVAKNAAQLSPQMAQGISGKDAITLEQMDAGQQGANAALGFGGLALSMLPGVGKGVNIARATSKKAAQEGLEEAAAKATQAFDDVDSLASIFKNGKAITKKGNPTKSAMSKAEVSTTTDSSVSCSESRCAISWLPP